MRIFFKKRSQGESAVFFLDPDTSECLHYEHVLAHPRRKHIGIPQEIMADHPEIDIRYDLLDCSIDICSVEVCLCSNLFARFVFD